MHLQRLSCFQIGMVVSGGGLVIKWAINAGKIMPLCPIYFYDYINLNISFVVRPCFWALGECML